MVERRVPGAERHSTSYPGWVIDETGRRQPVTITSLSGEGCGVTGAMLKVGERLDLLVSGHGSFTIEVRWTAGDRAGARFLG